MLLRARDVMNPKVISVRRDMDLYDLAKMFLQEGISGAPVVDRNGNLVGVISQTDLVYYNLTRGDELVDISHFYQHARVEGRHLPGGFQIEDTNTGRVADLMTPVVHAVTEQASLRTVSRLMTRKHIHRVIVRRGRKPIGVISALDILRAFEKDVARNGAPARRATPKKRPARKPVAKSLRRSRAGS